MREMNLKNEFENWLVETDGKSSNTAQQYKSSINLISRHYSKHTNETIDLYNINDVSFIKDLAKDYGLDGKYKNFGQNGNGAHGHATVRNAIAAYARFIEYKNSGYKSKENEIDSELKIKNENNSLVSLWKVYNNANVLITKLINEHSQIKKILEQINSKNEEKQKIIHKIPTSPIEISFKLLKTDKNNNKYYTYPANEELFKKEAFENEGVIVGIIHQNGYIEYIERRVSKIWETSVYWNINSMPMEYKNLIHISHANNLTVYACPINIDLKSNKQWQREIASKTGKK